MKKATKFALMKTTLILLGYPFLGAVFGLLLQRSGPGVFQASLISTPAYTGPMQFTLVDTLTSDLSYVVTAAIALFVNSRRAFYGLTLTERFKEMRKTYPCMVFPLTDETCPLLCSMAHPPDLTNREWKVATFFTSFSNRCYWTAGSVLGALMSEPITSDTIGIDLVMTALFVAICVGQWRAAKTHIPAITSFIRDALFLVLIRSSNFILPALAAAVAILLFLRKTVEQKMKED